MVFLFVGKERFDFLVGDPHGLAGTDAVLRLVFSGVGAGDGEKVRF